MSHRVFLVAAEPSGDLLGREVAQALKAKNPTITLGGIGGAEMASEGLSSDIDTRPLSVLGLFEGLKAYRQVVKLADASAAEILAFCPDIVVLIDSWGFMLRVAQRLKKQTPDLHLIKLIGPQVWATRAGRAKTLAATVDQVLVMFGMETPFYEAQNLPVTVVGSPALGRSEKGDGAAFRERYGFSNSDQVLLVLPGSRRGEIKRVAPVLVDVAKRVKDAASDVQIVFAPASEVAGDFETAFPECRDFALISTDPKDRFDAMAASDLALACSGTVTSELAVQGTPFLVAYKLGWITWAIARGFLYKPEFMALLNIAAKKEVAREFFQTKLDPEEMSKAALSLLHSPDALRSQRQEQDAALAKMGVGKASAAELAADAILETLLSQPQRLSTGT